jgi:hypothetical protein
VLTATILGAHPSAQTAAPGVTFRLRIEDSSERPVHAIVLRCQTRIEPRGRRYSKEEQARLYELFGDVSQWDRTLRGVTWAHSTVAVPSFERRIDCDLPIACTYDLEVASAKYLHAIRDGEVPLVFLFSGTVFSVAGGSLCMEPVSWDVEASFRMPASIWQSAMDQFFPGGGWLRLRRETIDRLQAFRGRQALMTWDHTIDRLLAAARAEEPA